MDGASQQPRDRSVIGSRELPIPKGRIAWFIARWEAAQARLRTPYPSKRAWRTPQSIYNRVTWHLWPWTCREYPGRAAIVAALCGVTSGTAMHYGKAHRRLPRHIALALATYLRSHAAQSMALALELEAYANESETINPRGVGFREVKVRDLTGIPRDGRVRKTA